MKGFLPCRAAVLNTEGKVRFMSGEFPEMLEKISAIRNMLNEYSSVSSSDPASLMAVTKFVDADRINYAIEEGGIRLIGENRPQELVQKYPQLHLDGVSVHMIGTLQTNKVKYIIDKVDMIQSLDSLKLAAEIDRQAQKHDKKMNVLIEINIGEEPQKGGILPGELEAFQRQLQPLSNIRVCGLMTIGPQYAQPEAYGPCFSRMQTLFRHFSEEYLRDIEQPLLSMGMSHSFREALLHGSNLIRVGSGIFGERRSSPPVMPSM